MSENKGPWDLPPAPKPPRSGEMWRVLIWLGVIAAGGAGVWALNRLYPGKITGSDWVYPLNGLGFLALVASGMVATRRMKVVEIVKGLGLWAMVAAVLLVGYTYREDFVDMGARLRSELIPSYAAPASPGVVALSQSRDGDYEVMGAVDDEPVRFIVDTGASEVVLSPADARRIGIDVDALDFSHSYETANGAGHAARVTVDSVSIGSIRLNHVRVSVNRTPMSASLLGMTFLRRLDSFEFKHGQLILRAPKA